MESKSGSHVLTFDEGAHKYILDGQEVPSVSAIAKCYPTSPFLINWQIQQGVLNTVERLKEYEVPVGMIPKEELKELARLSQGEGRRKARAAAEIGSLAHDYAYEHEKFGKASPELLEKIKTAKDSEKVNACVGKFLSWKKSNSDEVIGAEEIIASTSWSYAGRYDRLAVRGGKVVLSDFKTSSGVYVDHFMQLAGYALAIYEWTGAVVEAIEVLRFGKKDGKFEVVTISDLDKIEDLSRQFLNNLQTYQFMKRWTNVRGD